jgi:Fe-S-cluster containining protein
MEGLFGVTLMKNWKAGFFAIGQCNQCGACCCLTPPWKNLSDSERAILRKFDSKAEDVLNVKVNGKCKYLEFKNDGTTYCRNYKQRPRFCQIYPLTPYDWIEECCIAFIECKSLNSLVL